MKNGLIDYLKNNNYNIKSDNSSGVSISYSNNEVLIKGCQIDLIELAEYILNIALSNSENDHIHLDELTLISPTSAVCNLIIEKE